MMNINQLSADQIWTENYMETEIGYPQSGPSSKVRKNILLTKPLLLFNLTQHKDVSLAQEGGHITHYFLK